MASHEREKPPVHERLIAAAFEEFSSKGILGSTTRAIAERAGCNEVTLFRHFGSKEALLEASVAHAAADLLDVCRLRGLAKGELRGDLRRFAGIYDGVMTRTEGIARALIGEGAGIPASIGKILESFHGAMEAYLRDQRAAGAVSGALDLAMVAQSFTATLAMGSLRRSAGHLSGERAAWLDHVAGLYARALGAESAAGE
jgi:AcrR family transcriptional regulator